MPSTKHKKSYLATIIALTLLAVFVLPNLAFAQNNPAQDPPTLPGGVVLNKEAFTKAQTSLAECNKFKADVWNATAGAFKATYVVTTVADIERSRGCYVVPGDAQEGVYKGILGNRSDSSKELENL